jgi:hypothetical protein
MEGISFEEDGSQSSSSVNRSMSKSISHRESFSEKLVAYKVVKNVKEADTVLLLSALVIFAISGILLIKAVFPSPPTATPAQLQEIQEMTHGTYQ